MYYEFQRITGQGQGWDPKKSRGIGPDPWLLFCWVPAWALALPVRAPEPWAFHLCWFCSPASEMGAVRLELICFEGGGLTGVMPRCSFGIH